MTGAPDAVPAASLTLSELRWEVERRLRAAPLDEQRRAWLDMLALLERRGR